VVLVYAIAMQGTSIYEMVSGAYQVPLVGAFVPLAFGLYWSKATTQGAVLSIALGLLTWLLFLATPMGDVLPAQGVGLVVATLAMVAGSLSPQWMRNVQSSHRFHPGMNPQAGEVR
jgi:Na+/proline symporter